MYEYKTINADGGPISADQLNDFGKDGWLLVSIVAKPEPNCWWVYMYRARVQ